MKIPISNILANPEQPRIEFVKTELQALANSIREEGLINAIAVEEGSNGQYTLIDGERRLRACKLLGWKEIEATVLESRSSASGRLSKALVANIQRTDLNPIEEAKSYKNLKQMGLSNAAIAHRTGVSAPRILSRMKLLEMPEEIQDLYAASRLPVDVRATEALLKVEDRQDRIELAQRLAQPGTTIKTIVKACEHYNALKNAKALPKGTPAITLAKVKIQKNQREVPAWSVLTKLGKLPPWDVVEKAAATMCEACPLVEGANEQVCKGCAGLEMILEMMRAADERK